MAKGGQIRYVYKTTKHKFSQNLSVIYKRSQGILMKIILYILFFAVLSFAQTTMCYKDGVVSPSIMETALLVGSDCQNKTIKDMQKDGWIIKDIQILKVNNKLNFVYIFTKAEVLAIKPLETKEPEVNMPKAKEMFTARCSRCHKTNDLELTKHKIFDDFLFKLEQYGRDEIDGNNAYLMTPVANSLTEEDAKMIYLYIKSDNKK